MYKKLYLFLIFCTLSLCIFSQKRKVQNQPYGDHRLHHFGLTVGFNFQDMILTNSGFTGEGGETWFCEIPNYNLGFSVGMISDLFLNPYMNLRVTPTVHFGDRAFMFKEKESEELFKTNVRSNYLMLPVDIKFSSRRLNNYRPYFLAGLYASMDLGAKKDEPIRLKTRDFGFQVGFGCDFYLPIVKVCPEIRFYFGLSDLIEKDRSDLTDKTMLKYTDALSKGTSRMVVVTFNFE
jgi:hypothetical protein